MFLCLFLFACLCGARMSAYIHMCVCAPVRLAGVCLHMHVDKYSSLFLLCHILSRKYVFKGKQAPLLDQAKSSKSCFCKIPSVKFASQPRQSICSCDSTGCLPGLHQTRTKDLTVPVELLEDNFCRPAC